MYTLQSFGALDLTCLYEVEYPVGAGESVSGIARAIGGYGFFDNDGAAQAQPLLPRPYAVSGVVVKPDRYQLETWLNTLRSLRGTRGTLTRRMLDGSLQTATARLVGAPMTGAPGMTSHQALDLQFELVTFWRGLAHTTSFTLDASGYNVFYAVNAGTARVSDCILTVKAITTPITIIAVTTLYAKNNVQWNGTLAANHTLTIDSGTLKILDDTAAAWSGASFAGNYALDWLAIPALTTETVSVTITGGGAANEVAFYWHDTYE